MFQALSQTNLKTTFPNHNQSNLQFWTNNLFFFTSQNLPQSWNPNRPEPETNSTFPTITTQHPKTIPIIIEYTRRPRINNAYLTHTHTDGNTRTEGNRGVGGDESVQQQHKPFNPKPSSANRQLHNRTPERRTEDRRIRIGFNTNRQRTDPEGKR